MTTILQTANVQLEGTCMHEGRKRTKFTVTKLVRAANRKTVIATGTCNDCGSGMSRIIKKAQEAEILSQQQQETQESSKESTSTEATTVEGEVIYSSNTAVVEEQQQPDLESF